MTSRSHSNLINAVNSNDTAPNDLARLSDRMVANSGFFLSAIPITTSDHLLQVLIKLQRARVRLVRYTLEERLDAVEGGKSLTVGAGASGSPSSC